MKGVRAWPAAEARPTMKRGVGRASARQCATPPWPARSIRPKTPSRARAVYRLDIRGLQRGPAPDAADPEARRDSRSIVQWPRPSGLQAVWLTALAKAAPSVIRAFGELEGMTLVSSDRVRPGPVAYYVGVLITPAHRRNRRSPGNMRLARSISAGSPPMDLPHSRPATGILDRQHRGRVDSLTLKDALDQLAALGHAGRFWHRPGGRVAFPAAPPRRGLEDPACACPPFRPPSPFAAERG